VPDADVQAGHIYLHSNGSIGILYLEGPGAGAVPPPAEYREYRPRIYYIRNYSNAPGDGMPSLCRKELGVGNPTPITTDCVASGIEDLQVEYGLDTDGDGTVNQYLPDPTLADLQDITAVRVTLVARTMEEDRGYTDDRTYTVGNAPARTPSDHFHRRVYSTTVTVHNIRNLRRMAI
jgi:hypothetical protein